MDFLTYYSWYQSLPRTLFGSDVEGMYRSIRDKLSSEGSAVLFAAFFDGVVQNCGSVCDFLASTNDFQFRETLRAVETVGWSKTAAALKNAEPQLAEIRKMCFLNEKGLEKRTKEEIREYKKLRKSIDSLRCDRDRDTLLDAFCTAHSVALSGDMTGPLSHQT